MSKGTQRLAGKACGILRRLTTPHKLQAEARVRNLALAGRSVCPCDNRWPQAWQLHAVVRRHQTLDPYGEGQAMELGRRRRPARVCPQRRLEAVPLLRHDTCGSLVENVQGKKAHSERKDIERVKPAPSEQVRRPVLLREFGGGAREEEKNGCTFWRGPD